MPVLRKTHYPKCARLELEAQTGKRVVTGETSCRRAAPKKSERRTLNETLIPLYFLFVLELSPDSGRVKSTP